MAHKLSRAQRIKLLAMEMQELKPFDHGEIDILRREIWPLTPGRPTGPDSNSNTNLAGHRFDLPEG